MPLPSLIDSKKVRWQIVKAKGQKCVFEKRFFYFYFECAKAAFFVYVFFVSTELIWLSPLFHI